MKDKNYNFPNLDFQLEDIIIKNIFKGFDNLFSTERKLNEMFIGAVRVLSDYENLDRYSQSANSIVNIFDGLLKNIAFPELNEKILEDKDLENLSSSFNEVINKFKEKLQESENRKKIIERVQQNYKNLCSSLQFKISLKKEQIADLIKICRERVGYELIANAIEDLENIYGYFIKVKHDPNVNERDFLRQLQLAKNFFKVLVRSHTIFSNLLDKILEKEKKSEEDLKELEIYFKEDEKIKDLFFRKCDDPELFEWLRDTIKAFNKENIEEPSINDEGRLIIPIFTPLYYINNITKKIPGKVFPIIYSIETKNTIVIQQIVISIKELPKELIHKFLPKIDKWLDLEYKDYFMNDIYDLLDILIELNNFTDSSILLRSLVINTKIERRNNRFDFLRIKDMFEKKLDSLILALPGEILDIIENKLETLIKKDTRYSEIKGYNSKYWRHSISLKSDRDIYSDEEKNILVNIIMKIIETTYNSNNKLIERKLIEYYREKENLIYKRIAIHYANLFDYEPLIKEILLEKDNLLDDYIDAEYLEVLDKRFSILNEMEQKELLENLLNIGDED